jgi:hypothetical protein
VRVVVVPVVQSHLRAEPAELTKQKVSAPLLGGQSRLQDPEVGTIQSFSLFISFSYYLIYIVGFYVAEEKYWGRTPLLGCLGACTRR